MPCLDELLVGKSPSSHTQKSSTNMREVVADSAEMGAYLTNSQKKGGDDKSVAVRKSSSEPGYSSCVGQVGDSHTAIDRKLLPPVTTDSPSLSQKRRMENKNKEYKKDASSKSNNNGTCQQQHHDLNADGGIGSSLERKSDDDEQKSEESDKPSLVARSLSFGHEDLRPPGISFLKIPDDDASSNGGGGGGKRRPEINKAHQGKLGEEKETQQRSVASASMTVVKAFKEGWRRIFHKKPPRSQNNHQCQSSHERGGHEASSSSHLRHSHRRGKRATPRPAQTVVSPARRYFGGGGGAAEFGGVGDGKETDNKKDSHYLYWNHHHSFMIDQLQKRSAVKLQIEGLDAPSMNMMLCQQLNVKKIPDPVLNFIVHRAHCNPFVASEILGALRAKGVISVSSSNDNADDGKVVRTPTKIVEILLSFSRHHSKKL
mmetsp:Transcript_11971/g.19881  ORF Transcript_11971/g.19881 Transcript_11971/m.19881 type:complete len:430 (+) Transcript_11971:299-1588(+)